ncbi:MAG: bifunctional 4'-phosphopantothenoylcysteine decarboxylase/phosphopantothenoylcysteine synthetase [Lysobacterales bacterium 13-68-4]|jgi:phosphopantothenoylcysteine decarboxylase/phosphopantothenate--cysteine ligase|nr:MAG: bifunctional 4'-phosphopantothenoylcysteine decarboxylase/phosphopantothenoylcysteine synthetase [Xanthomonadales bacterium 15-68-25]OZB66565.1 MAG: bifunctional 4'-phosphopantothenoylcysteine decarboxylase/phosphopantothenoylcysteine synthetase [Xanthomonadales bacterium 14-68-21]OZB69618.1 MAG: bifunctional 4'-phosphopantothenoylcysteine decarboxylase/phosphopantothenoylcysteine synthetase [Xanthomonadales bacterium 13-68-4]
MSLAHRRILLGVSGGIAAYKSCELVRRLRDLGAEVRVVMTEGATHFVTPTTFQALSGAPVRVSLWDESAEAAMGHIELARWAERILVAPASADVLARLAHGQADDLLTTLCLASAAPVAVAPAMNQQMWAHPAVQANLATLRSRGVTVLGPAAGEQACGDVGSGRMLEPLELRDALVASFGSGLLAGRHVVVSAGPTYEDIDPVRFIGNRSSGKMGFAVAEACALAGARVTLVAGPVGLPTPAGVAQRIDVRSAAQMHAAVLEASRGADIYIAAAAVGDYRPQQVAPCKLKKQAGADLTLTLAENPDILASLSALPEHPFLVGFAAETHDVATYAQDKLRRKKLDMIAANQVGEGLGFETTDNALTLYWDGGSKELPRASKNELARALVACVAERFQGARA